MPYITPADVQDCKQTSYTSSSWTNDQYLDAIVVAEAWADERLQGYGGVSLTAIDWDDVKQAMCVYALAELCAGSPSTAILRREAINSMLNIKRHRNCSYNRVRDDGQSMFGRGDAAGKITQGAARSAIF